MADKKGSIKKLPPQKQPVNQWQDPKAVKWGGDKAWAIELDGDEKGGKW